MTDLTAKAIANTFLFRGLSEGEISAALSDLKIELRDFSRSEAICTPKEFKREVGFVISGECEVVRDVDDGSRAQINTIGEGGTFGILSVFSDSGVFPTVILAKKRCRVAFIDAPSVKRLVERNNKIAFNVISFLTDRVMFLNERLTTFSGGSVEQKLASYLIALCKSRASAVIEFNKSKSAAAIGAGRASLYRALASFEAQGVIRVEEKNIVITDLYGLERISK